MTPRWTVTLGCALVGVLALALRGPGLRDSLWLDELHTAWCVAGNWLDVAPRARIGNQSPLFFYLLRGVTGTWGLTELVLRLPSLIAGLLVLLAAGGLVGRWTKSPTAGLLAALLLAVDRHFVFYAQEARPYALLQLVAWCHAAVVWRLASSPTRRRRLAYIAGAALMFHLHYTALLFVAGEWCYLGGCAVDASRRRQRESAAAPDRAALNADQHYGLGAWRIDLLLIVLACTPAGWHLATVAEHRQAWSVFVPEPNWSSVVQVFRLDVYLYVPLVVLAVAGWIERCRGRSGVAPLAEPLTPVPLPLGKGEGKLEYAGRWRCPEPRAIGLVSCLLVVPAGLAYFSTETEVARLLFRRYLVSSLVAPPVLAALICWSLPVRWQRLVLAAAIVALSVGTSGMLESWRQQGRWVADRRQDWRRAIQFVNERQASRREIVFVRSGFLEADRLRAPHDPLLGEFCLAPVRSLYRLDIPAWPLPFRHAAQWDDSQPRRIAESETVWFIINGGRESRREFEQELAPVLRAVDARLRIAHRQEFGEILVLQVRSFAENRVPSPLPEGSG